MNKQAGPAAGGATTPPRGATPPAGGAPGGMAGVDWRWAWQLATGRPAEEEWLAPWQASLTYFALVMTLGLLLRLLTSALAPRSLRPYLISMLATTEVCAYFFENNFVLLHYGNVWLYVAIVLQCFVASRTFLGGSENPCHAIRELVFGKMPPLQALTFVVFQTLGGLASYRVARLVWALDMIADHHERYVEVSCESDLHVTLAVGLAVELAAALSDTWLGLQTLSSRGLLDELIKYSNGAVMIIAGIHLTGMYFNPAMASGHMFGCQGTEALEHVAVYWAGPVAGCILAGLLDKMVHIDRAQPAKPVPESKKTQ